MKRIIYIFPILLLACGQTSNKDRKVSNHKIDNTYNLTTEHSDSETVVDKTTKIDSANSLEIIKEFAVSYAPTSYPNRVIAILPEPSDTFLTALEMIKNSNPEQFEKYLTLIFVKLYRAHLECCNQSYEVRRKPTGKIDKEQDPLVYEFITLVNKYPKNKRIEFISSSIGYDYVKSNPHLMDYEPIKEHIQIIDRFTKTLKKAYIRK